MGGSSSIMDEKAEGHKRSMMVTQKTLYSYVRELWGDTGTLKLVFYQLYGGRDEDNFSVLSRSYEDGASHVWRDFPAHSAVNVL